MKQVPFISNEAYFQVSMLRFTAKATGSCFIISKRFGLNVYFGGGAQIGMLPFSKSLFHIFLSLCTHYSTNRDGNYCHCGATERGRICNGETVVVTNFSLSTFSPQFTSVAFLPLDCLRKGCWRGSDRN